MPTYLLIGSISNISFNIAIFAWLFDMEIFRIFLVPLYPLYPLLIYVITTQIPAELQLFNYIWHSIHLFYVIQSIGGKKLCRWQAIPIATALWIVYMALVTIAYPQMRFILLPLDQAIFAVVFGGIVMTIIMYHIQNIKREQTENQN
jgi:hypothetical protein